MTDHFRPTGASVTVLDVEQLNKALAEHFPVEGDEQPLKAYPQVLALKHGTDDQWAVICEEGVGWEVVDGEVGVLVHAGMFIMDTIRLPIDAVLAAAEESTEVELADSIRRFGDRLETNFNIWYQFVTGKHTWEVAR